MGSFIIKRLLILLPMLLLMSVVAFVLSLSSPGDPVERLLQNAESAESSLGNATRMNRRLEAAKLRKQLGLNLPVFYFSIQTLADIDSLHTLDNPLHKDGLKRMARETGQPELVKQWYNKHQKIQETLNVAFEDTNKLLKKNYLEQVNSVLSLLESTLLADTYKNQKAKVDSLSNLFSLIPEIQQIRANWEKEISLFNSLYENKASWKKYLPSIHWFGLENQYHYWLFGNGSSSKGVVRGDFGISYRDKRNISEHLSSAIPWTLFLSGISIFIAFAVSIPLGLAAGRYKGSAFDWISSSTVFALYALPSFFVASLLLVVFANPDFLDWFPSSGIKDPENFNPEWSFFLRLQHYWPYLVLPIISMTYASFAFISRQVRSGVIEANKKDYVRTARAKGLSENEILKKHILPNILFPLITILGQLIPLLFGGSVIIESIFSIPGMGLEMFESVINYDYPMIIAIFTLVGFFTMIGYLLSDVLYALADPRVKFNANKS